MLRLGVGFCTTVLGLMCVLFIHPTDARSIHTYFSETGYTVDASILHFWRAGGVELYGYPISPLIMEQSLDDGLLRPVQYFERARFEVHHSAGGASIRLGRLGAEMLTTGAAMPPVDNASNDCLFFAPTAQSLCGPFAHFWATRGGLERFGYPLTPPHLLTASDGSVREVQYTERARLERLPSGQAIQLGLLGRERYRADAQAQPVVLPTHDPAIERMVELVNNERRAAGLAPLSIAPELMASAQEHSWGMALSGLISHTGSDGRGAAQRMRDAGYNWQRCGENIAVGQTTPEEAMAFWMNSPPHRANILDPGMREIGVGYVQQPTGYGHYWTLNLGER
jgi:uncharacterized protein YkwD